MGWWIALGIVVLLAILPLGVNVCYDEDGPTLRILAGPIRYTLIPKKKKDKPPKEKKPAKSVKKEVPPEQTPAEKEPTPTEPDGAQSGASGEPTQKKGGSILDFLPLVEIALDFVGEFFGKTLHIDVLYLKFTMAGGDPYSLALNYGRAWEAVGILWPKLEEWLTIKKRDIQIQVDFEGSQTLVNARVDITLTLGRLISLAVRYGIKALRAYLKIQKTRKGGAKA